jgi:hypothetical protein
MGQLEKQIVEGKASINPRNEGVNPKLVTKNKLFPARKSCFNSERYSDSDLYRRPNRELFDNFEKIVEDDARWAYRFQRKFSEKLKDRDDIYLEVKTSEERRKRKGLPPRVLILPDWDMSRHYAQIKGFSP